MVRSCLVSSPLPFILLYQILFKENSSFVFLSGSLCVSDCRLLTGKGKKQVDCMETGGVALRRALA